MVDIGDFDYNFEVKRVCMPMLDSIKKKRRNHSIKELVVI